MPKTPTETPRNLAAIILEHAVETPERHALTIPLRYNREGILEQNSLTYGELGLSVAGIQSGLRQEGLVPGDRVVLMIGVSADLYVVTLALFLSGLVAVLIDPGMSKANLLNSLKLSRAKAIISKRQVLRLWPFLPPIWSMKRFAIDGDCSGVRSLEELKLKVARFSLPRKDEIPSTGPALITYTSGTTGHPKGSDRSHDLLVNQHEILLEEHPPQDDDIDMSSFPVVTLHSLAVGVHSVLPCVDFGAPGSVDPETVIRHAREVGATRITGAPAYLGKIADHLVERGQVLEKVRLVICGGGPTSRRLCRKLLIAFPNAHTELVYGCTEADPITSIDVKEILNNEGKGYLVGRPNKHAQVKIVSLAPECGSSDGASASEVPNGGIGEIVVRGKHVLRRYLDNPEANSESKIRINNQYQCRSSSQLHQDCQTETKNPLKSGSLDVTELWHRTKDTGYLDSRGRLWLVGRQNYQVAVGPRTLHPYLIESEIDSIDGVLRAALVSGGTGRGAALYVMLEDPKQQETIVPLINKVLQRERVDGISLKIVSSLPMDGRHNSKVERSKLSRPNNRLFPKALSRAFGKYAPNSEKQ